MAGAEVAAVARVVGELLVPQATVRVADQPVTLHLRGVELDLQLHVVGDREQRGAHLLDQHAPRLEQAVDVRVVPVAVISELLHLRVLQIAGPEAEDAEVDARLALPLDQLDELAAARHPDVEVAVGSPG